MQPRLRLFREPAHRFVDGGQHRRSIKGSPPRSAPVLSDSAFREADHHFDSPDYLTESIAVLGLQRSQRDWKYRGAISVQGGRRSRLPPWRQGNPVRHALRRSSGPLQHR